jgi:hypothetical protein
MTDVMRGSYVCFHVKLLMFFSTFNLNLWVSTSLVKIQNTKFNQDTFGRSSVGLYHRPPKFLWQRATHVIVAGSRTARGKTKVSKIYIYIYLIA